MSVNTFFPDLQNILTGVYQAKLVFDFLKSSILDCVIVFEIFAQDFIPAQALVVNLLIPLTMAVVPIHCDLSSRTG